ncbi:EF-hand domain-containing protein 1-like [Macrosteles quadrilineatus]|uniref:EF-hand domain-containing protein 1-like n=1 Tax=Macrosteles quadrilineatus TaxID=74068 RepID=UPI0023E1AEBF|nr:EF-hand domain-containing protein 1-like [Macrosteles quadrilineatus]
MEGLPLLPGYAFRDITQSKFNVSHHFDVRNGYAVSRKPEFGIGKTPLDVNSVRYHDALDPIRFDPSLIYGRAKSYKIPTFTPHFVQYDKKCLTFRAFFRQSVAESPDEHFRIRQVNIIYFLEDDTLTVMEPPVQNAGYDQGRLVRRAKIPKGSSGQHWHWKDLNVGIDLVIYGITYHICNCDEFTTEFLLSQGLELNAMEEVPQDPYMLSRQGFPHPPSRAGPVDDKLRRFLEYDGKVLRFYAVWDERESGGEMRKYVIYYYLANDTVEIGEVKTPNSGHDSFPKLLNKMKVPKNWKDIPQDYPSIFMERSDAEVTEYYQPKDFMVGNTVHIMARKFMIYDCDAFTRKYFSHCLQLDQPAAIKVLEEKPAPPPPPLPPHIGIGAPEDTAQSCYSFMPKPPKKDMLRYIINAGKKLRYTAVLDWVHPEDKDRQFMIEYNLANGEVLVQELKVPNSGFVAGRFLRPMCLPKPGSNPDNPQFYTPGDFNIGSIVDVFGHRFKITSADLAVYKYMEANPEKFSEQTLQGMRAHMVRLGLLNQEIKGMRAHMVRLGLLNQEIKGMRAHMVRLGLLNQEIKVSRPSSVQIHGGQP